MILYAYQKNRHRNLQKIILLTVCYLSATAMFSALNAQTYKKNKYGLHIIEQKSQYRADVAADSSRRLVPLKSFIADLKTDFVYATSDNFTKTVLYRSPVAYLRLPAAKALQRAADRFRKLGYGLLVFDAYRPYRVTVDMWQVVPDNRYAADPKHGSGHNKGICVDLSLYDLQTGQALAMPTGFDDFTAKAHQGFMKLPATVLHNRELLKSIMAESGFLPLSTEWWHFSYPDPERKFELLNLTFQQLGEIDTLSGSID
jgi:D-alanyl-D-alanine dipeptidase